MPRHDRKRGRIPPNVSDTIGSTPLIDTVPDILAVIYGSASKPLDTFEKSYTISLTEAAYERALHECRGKVRSS